MTEVTIGHNPNRERFEVLAEGNVVGRAAYKEYDGGDSPQRIFYHTVINEEHRGQGLAGKLAKKALDETAKSGVTIVPVCRYIKKFLRKHPEHEGNTTAPTPAHLEFLDDALAPGKPS